MNNSYYMIVRGSTVRSLTNSVSKAMLEGWYPSGGMTIDRPSGHEIIPVHHKQKSFYVTQTAGAAVYYQAMVKPTVHGG